MERESRNSESGGEGYQNNPKIGPHRKDGKLSAGHVECTIQEYGMNQVGTLRHISKMAHWPAGQQPGD